MTTDDLPRLVRFPVVFKPFCKNWNPHIMFIQQREQSLAFLRQDTLHTDTHFMCLLKANSALTVKSRILQVPNYVWGLVPIEYRLCQLKYRTVLQWIIVLVCVQKSQYCIVNTIQIANGKVLQPSVFYNNLWKSHTQNNILHINYVSISVLALDQILLIQFCM